MADNQTMSQLLQAPTEGYEDAIVIPEINANFELKNGLINLVQYKQFFGHDKEDPHAHIRYFNKITSTMRFSDIPSTSIKLMLFPFSLEGSARIWLEKEPPRSILTWDDLYTFYNALNANDQDSLNSAAGGNFLDKMPRECLRIIESKSKVRNSRNKAVVAKVSSNSSTPGISPDVAALTTEVSELKNMMKTMLIDKQKAQAPAPVKAVEQSCVTCGGAHSYRNCPATDGNVYRDNIQEYVSQAAAARLIRYTTSRTSDGFQTKYPKNLVSFDSTTIKTVSNQNQGSNVQPKIENQFQSKPWNHRFYSSKDEPISALPLFIHAPSSYSSHVKTSDNLEEFADELTLLDSFPPGNDDSVLKKDVECSDPEVDIDEIDAFLAMEVSSNFEEGDLIPPGVENDDFEDEDNSTFLPEHESPNLDHQDNPSAPRPPPEPPDVKIRLEPDTAVINNFDVLNKEACFNLEEGVQIFLPFFTYPEDSPFILSFGSEDLVFI
ncbi:hypothetical protein Tco_0886083 [Tanacetum coccineum]